MPSQLIKNDNVSFIVSKSFRYNGEDYERGQEFDQATIEGTLSNIETMVRNRYLIPVVDDLSDKPRHWYREIKQRDQVMARLAATGSVYKGPHTEVEERPSEAEQLTEGALSTRVVKPPASVAPDYKPGKFSNTQVKAFVKQHPDQAESVLDKESRGKNRPRLISWLEQQVKDSGEE
jgi:hypothetical protein